MGRKVHPMGFRLGGIRDWQARWYAEKNYAEYLHEDLKLRQAIQSGYAEAGVSQVQIDRQANIVSVTIHTARPGVVIGRGGQRVDKMRLHLESTIGKKIQLNIQEIHQAELDAYLVARTIADQLQNRIAYRRAMKQAISRTLMAGAKGIRISCAGRLGGVEIARRQTMHDGQVPLHTLRADIDYGLAEAHTMFGRIGIKVWIYKGDILPERKPIEIEEAPIETVTAESLEVPPEKVAAESVETPPEKVAVESAELAPIEVKPEAKPATRKTTRKAPPAKAKTPPEPVAAESVETPPESVAMESAKPPPEVKPEAKPAARKRVKKAPVPKPEKNITQPEVEATAEAPPSTSVEEVTKDATTQAGEIPQDS